MVAPDQMPRKASALWRWLGVLGSLALILAALYNLKQLKAQVNDEGPEILRTIDPIRIDLKLALDKDAPSPASTLKPASLKKLLEFPRPAELQSKKDELHDKRYAPLETTIWRVQARVIDVVLREDSDVYLVIEEGGFRTVAEIPDPELCRQSPFYEQIKRVREQIELNLKPTHVPKKVMREAELTGIGFFGKAGPGKNGARLYPLLSLKWLPERKQGSGSDAVRFP